jgi:hypothetical protein
LIITNGLLQQWSPGAKETSDSTDPAAKAAIERAGMEAVLRHERELGFHPQDVSHENCGWDITSTDREGNCRFIEVKARKTGAATITVTKNEMLVGYNKQRMGWYLAIVLVDGDRVDGPHYIEAPFDREPGWAETSVNLNIPRLLEQKINPAAKSLS